MLSVSAMSASYTLFPNLNVFSQIPGGLDRVSGLDIGMSPTTFVIPAREEVRQAVLKCRLKFAH